MILRGILTKIFHGVDDLRAVLHLIKDDEGLFRHYLLTACQHQILQDTVNIFCSFKELLIFLVLVKVEISKHLPIGYYGDYDNHSHITKILGYQVEYTKEAYDELWKTIVAAKLLNQKKVLIRLGRRIETIKKIEDFCVDIKAGDTSNREAHGAKVYFNELMGTSFSRGNENILLNAGLDYGYTIMRSYIARLCVGYGLNCQIGIHHKNEYNRFNLVDDLMEPVRPFVDLYVYHLLENEEFFKIDQ